METESKKPILPDRVITKPFITFKTVLIFTVIFALLMIPAVIYYAREAGNIEAATRESVIRAAEPYYHSLFTQLTERRGQLKGLSAFALSNNELGELDKEFNVFARGLATEEPGIRAVEIAPGGVITYVYPEKGNEIAKNADIINDKRPDVKRDVKKLIDSRKVMLGGPYQLLQGGQGLVAREPLYNEDGSFWAIAQIVFNVNNLIMDAGLGDKKLPFKFLLTANNGSKLYGDAAVNGQNPVVEKINIMEMTLKFSAVPSGGWAAASAPRRNNLIIMELTFVIFLSFLLTGAIDRQRYLNDLVASKVSELKESNMRLTRADRINKLLTATDDIIIHAIDETSLYDEVCRAIVEVGGFRMCWIGMIDSADESVLPVAMAGAVEGYFDEINVSVRDIPEGQGQTGTAIRENKTVVCDDIENDPTMALWREQSLKRGYKRTGAFPIVSEGTPVGALTVYSEYTGPVGQDVITVMEEIVSDISFAREKIDQALELDHAASFPRVNPSPIVEFHVSGVVLYHNEAAARALERAGLAEQFDLFKPKDVDLMAELFAEHPGISTQYREVDIGEKTFGESIIYFKESETFRIYTLDISDKKKFERELITRQDELEDSYQKLNKTLDDTVKAIAVLAEHKDPYTVGHEKKVVDLAMAIGAEIGLEENKLNGLRVAATLHDVGKMYIPAEILSKPGKLTDLEFSMIKVHPRYSYEVLSQIEFPWPVADIALQHHEREDGSGYPDGLKDGEILLEAKILAVADVVEAMASHRPYRPALDINEATEEISNNAGKLYDKDVVAAALAVLKKGFMF